MTHSMFQKIKTFMLVATVIAFMDGTFGNSSAQEVYQSPRDFLNQAFADHVPPPGLLSVSPEIRSDVERILRHRYGAERIRYWHQGAQTVWILEEIGKYKPITVGLNIADGRLESIAVLVYRESHGWEVRHSFFTDQFKGLTLDEENDLSGRVDGISGATLSVNALKNLARLALLFDKSVQKN